MKLKLCPSQIDTLIGSLNERGLRESDLKEKLISERDRLGKSVKRCQNSGIKDKLSTVALKKEEDSKESPDAASVSTIVDLTLRDQILEMEEKIFIGNLGTLKCRDRSVYFDIRSCDCVFMCIEDF